MHVDKTFLNPNIPRTIRFTPILFEWLMEVSNREKISFNQMVLLCCKECMDLEAQELGEKKDM